jgi:hypothetical protein
MARSGEAMESDHDRTWATWAGANIQRAIACQKKFHQAMKIGKYIASVVTHTSHQDESTGPGGHLGVNHPLRRALSGLMPSTTVSPPFVAAAHMKPTWRDTPAGRSKTASNPFVAAAGFAFLIPSAPTWRIGLPT